MKKSRSRIIAAFACALFGIFFLSTHARAQITIPITVGNTFDTVVAGGCVQGGNPVNCSLRAAIQQANAGSSLSIIAFAIPPSDPSCSAGVCTIRVATILPAITEPLAINGPGAEKLTIRPQPGGQFPVFRIDTPGSSVSISGLTISNGFAPTGPGGGIVNGSGTTTITNCLITGNQAFTFGGAISNNDTLTISNSMISGNFAGSGGGGIASVGTLTITNSTIFNNHSPSGSGGGISGSGAGTVNITNSTFAANSAARGGAIFAANGTLNVTNSTLTGNSANGNNGGGGIFVETAATPTVKSSIIALNAASPSGPDVSGSFNSGAFNLIGKRDGSIGFQSAGDQAGTIAAPLNPMLDLSGPVNNGGPTLTIAPLPGSPAIDKGTRDGLTGTLSTDQRGALYRRTFDNSAIPNPSGGFGTDVGALELQSKLAADFDGDNKTDIGIYRPLPAAEWWINSSSTGVTFALQFGQSADRITPGDYTSDGKSEIAFWRPSNGFWFILRSENFTFFSFPFGTTGDVPAPANYDGDQIADQAVFRPSTGTWFYRLSFSGGVGITQFGANGDVPVPGDYDGDGNSDLAIFRPSVGQWWINRSTAGVIAFTFGNAQDKPVQCDYTGDGKTDVAFWRPSTGQWFIIRSEDSSFFAFPFGTNGDMPAPGDYDGDGICDATVFRPSSATWFIARSTAGTQIVQFGANGDRPIPAAFIP